MNKLYLYGGIGLAVLLVGLLIGWKFFSPEPTKPETYAQAERHADGSLTPERKPMPDYKPRHKPSKGAVVERVVKFTVAPKEIELSASADSSTAPCPALDVELTLERKEDGSRRVNLYSENGVIVDGLDIPVETAKPYKELKWAAGLTANPIERTYGAFLDRDLGPFRLGAELNQIKDGYDFRLKAGVRF